MSGKNETEDTYAGPRSTNEYNRLRLQHYFIKHAMDGQLVYAPIKLTDPGLRILDSATGDGYWLVDLKDSVDATTHLVGADIAPQHFIPQPELPENVKLINHNIFEPWPEDFQDKFDLAHQRFVLMACNDTNSVIAIEHLLKCIKPGGWIQLHDGDMGTIEEGPEHAAMSKFRDIARTGWSALGFNLSPGPKLVGWLKTLGVVEIHERILDIKVGKASSDAEQGERVIEMLVASLDNMIGLASSTIHISKVFEMN